VCFTAFVVTDHSVVKSGIILTTFFSALAGFAVVPRIFGDAMRPAVSYVFSIYFSLEGWWFKSFLVIIFGEDFVTDFHSFIPNLFDCDCEICRFICGWYWWWSWMFVGLHPLVKDVVHLIWDELFDCFRTVAGTSDSCTVLTTIIIGSCEELFEIAECLFIFGFFSPLSQFFPLFRSLCILIASHESFHLIVMQTVARQ